MDIRPQDLPELRAELLAFSASPLGVQYWHGHSHLNYYRGIKASAEDLGKAVGAALSGDLYFVAAQMAELSCIAGMSLPRFDMLPEDVPSRSGFLMFEKVPPMLSGPDDGCSDPDCGCSADRVVSITGVAWSVDSSIECVWLVPVTEACEHGGLTLGGPRLYPCIATADAPVLTRELDLMDHLISALRAAWLLMQQPLAAISDVEPDRASRKRLRRAGREPASVRIIELRRPKHSGSEAGESGRTYAHTWIVRGHWRNHWHPKREVHRPVWIAPHVKGPEGAPMIGGEKVYAWKR
jgi:hypothetical protein